jgi:hypothetical protein
MYPEQITKAYAGDMSPGYQQQQQQQYGSPTQQPQQQQQQQQPVQNQFISPMGTPTTNTFPQQQQQQQQPAYNTAPQSYNAYNQDMNQMNHQFGNMNMGPAVSPSFVYVHLLLETYSLFLSFLGYSCSAFAWRKTTNQ